MPLGLLVAGLFVGLQALEKDARSRGLARIDATRYRLHSGSKWLSHAWTEQLERILVETRDLPADDPGVIADFAERVEALPFVAEVGEPEVQWPDGLTLPIRLHEPVACVRIGARDFLPVAIDGTILGGYAFSPHEAYGGWLPTLGPHGLLESEQGNVGPGDRVEVPALRAALQVADSMWRHLDVEDLRLLGRIVIDATRPDAPVFDREAGAVTPKTLPGGVVLELDQGRRVVFGRSPVPVQEGELPAGLKWDHVGSALTAWGEGEEWALLDARFDVGVLLTREEVLDFERRWKGAGADVDR
ncbi:MAG: hypothetical protein AAGI22_27020 [Planctomycetota bacterium]